MAKLTISDAARVCRVARSTLQRAVQAGRLSLDADHRVDTAELLRAGYTLHAARQDDDCRMRQGALQDAAPRSSSTRQDAAGPSTTVVLMKLRAVCSANIWRSLDANGARRTKPECAQRVAASPVPNSRRGSESR